MITELSWGFSSFLAAPNRSKKFFKKSRRAEFFFDEKFGFGGNEFQFDWGTKIGTFFKEFYGYGRG